MIKKLDKLILKAFIGPFIATFFVTIFVLVLQFFWLYIDDIVGKGLDLLTIGLFIMYVTATIVYLALPLAVLLSSIMTFGNLGETFELVAIKSAGIPLLRFMRPIFFASLFLCGVSFLFNNYIQPEANLKMQTMKYDIIVTKPALDIKEGVFYDKIEGYIIKIGKKDKNGSNIQDVLIYEQNFNLRDNVILAQKGKMSITPDKHFLQFDLENGWRYEEKGQRMTINTELTRVGFKEYKKVFDLSSFRISRTDDSAFKNNYRMLGMNQLGKNIDSLQHAIDTIERKSKRAFNAYLSFSKYIDTANIIAVSGRKISDSVRSILEVLPDTTRTNVHDQATVVYNNVKSNLEQPAFLYETMRKDLRLHLVSWHEKITMSVACIVFFLIGAPLGSIIRKGGIGLPLIFAVVFFVIFFLVNNIGTKLVKEDVLQPLTGMWMAICVLTPIGIFLTYKALHDSQLFNKEFYYRTLRGIRRIADKWQAFRSRAKKSQPVS